jgi:hypothetical protein
MRRGCPNKRYDYCQSQQVAKIRNFIENIGDYTMKNIIILLIGTFALTLTSCGTFAAYSEGNTQKFDDGIYASAPSLKNRSETTADKQEIDALIQQTKESPVYLFGDKKDSIIIPENMAATVRFDKDLGTSVTIASFDPYGIHPDYWNSPWYYNYYSSPWSYRGYYDPWDYGYSSWRYRYDPWYYRYDPWYYRHDPWYYGGWYSGFYDPWYYSYAGYYDPFHHYMHPYYCGWYGAWDPYYGAIHHRPPYGGCHHHIGGSSGSSKGVYRGSRQETVSTSNKVVAGNRVSSGAPASTTRKTATTSRSSFGTSRTASTRAVVGRSTTTSRSSSGSTTTYRKPAGTTRKAPGVDSSSDNKTSSYSRTPSRSSSGSTPSYNRGSSYSGGSSSGSYNRSSSGGSYHGGGHSGVSRSSSGSRR